MVLQPYRHSGRFTVASLLGGLMLSGLLAYGLGFLTAYGERHVPYVKLRLLVPIVAACGVGFLPVLAARALGMRNQLVALLIGCLSGLGALYVAWAYWLGMIFDSPGLMPGIWQRLQRPDYLWNLAMAISEDGVWGISRGEAVKGWYLLSLWGSEVALFLGAGIVGASVAMNGVFCERCGVWASDEKPVAVFGRNRDEATLVDALRRGDFDAAFALAVAPEVDDKGRLSLLELVDRCCEKCRRTRAITLRSNVITVAKDGTKTEKKKTLFDRLLVTDDQSGVMDAAQAKYVARLEGQAAELREKEAREVASAST